MRLWRVFSDLEMHRHRINRTIHPFGLADTDVAFHRWHDKMALLDIRRVQTAPEDDGAISAFRGLRKRCSRAWQIEAEEDLRLVVVTVPPAGRSAYQCAHLHLVRFGLVTTTRPEK
jgi:hypothetical protein